MDKYNKDKLNIGDRIKIIARFDPYEGFEGFVTGFKEAGFVVSVRLDGGVIDLDFIIADVEKI
jgi:hypothetical protein